MTVCEHIIFMTGILNKEALNQSPKCNFEADLIQATWETTHWDDVLGEMREQGGLVHLGHLTLIEG